MADDADDTTGSRPRLEAPQLFGRRRATSPVDPSEPTAAGTRRVRRQRRTRRTAGSAQVLDDEPVVADDSDTAPDPEDVEDAPPRRRRTRPSAPTLPSVPRLSGKIAAAAAGLLVGLSLLGLTWLGLRGCEAVRGTSSCGTAPGMAALIVVFVLAVVVGGVLLSMWGVPDPGASSFLGTGLTGVVILLFLVDHLDAWPVLVAIPLITAATFLASWWVTTTYVDPA